MTSTAFATITATAKIAKNIITLIMSGWFMTLTAMKNIFVTVASVITAMKSAKNAANTGQLTL